VGTAGRRKFSDHIEWDIGVQHGEEN